MKCEQCETEMLIGDLHNQRVQLEYDNNHLTVVFCVGQPVGIIVRGYDIYPQSRHQLYEPKQIEAIYQLARTAAL